MKTVFQIKNTFSTESKPRRSANRRQYFFLPENHAPCQRKGVFNSLNRIGAFFGGFLPFGSGGQVFTLTDVLLYALSRQILRIP
jgi:hypothetical protein